MKILETSRKFKGSDISHRKGKGSLVASYSLSGVAGEGRWEIGLQGGSEIVRIIHNNTGIKIQFYLSDWSTWI